MPHLKKKVLPLGAGPYRASIQTPEAPGPATWPVGLALHLLILLSQLLFVLACSDPNAYNIVEHLKVVAVIIGVHGAFVSLQLLWHQTLTVEAVIGAHLIQLGVEVLLVITLVILTLFVFL